MGHPRGTQARSEDTPDEGKSDKVAVQNDQQSILKDQPGKKINSNKLNALGLTYSEGK